MRIDINLNHNFKGELLVSNPAFEAQLSRALSAVSSLQGVSSSLTNVNSSLTVVNTSLSTALAAGDPAEVDATETADANELGSGLDALGIPSVAGVSSSLSGVSSSVVGVSSSVSALSAPADTFDDSAPAAPAD